MAMQKLIDQIEALKSGGEIRSARVKFHFPGSDGYYGQNFSPVGGKFVKSKGHTRAVIEIPIAFKNAAGRLAFERQLPGRLGMRHNTRAKGALYVIKNPGDHAIYIRSSGNPSRIVIWALVNHFPLAQVPEKQLKVYYRLLAKARFNPENARAVREAHSAAYRNDTQFDIIR
jgi:hypothetical protein